MGWSFRKSFGLVPGVRVNLSKTGPSVSIGVPGLRASMDTRGHIRVYGGIGALRYRKNIAVGPDSPAKWQNTALLAWLKRNCL